MLGRRPTALCYAVALICPPTNRIYYTLSTYNTSHLSSECVGSRVGEEGGGGGREEARALAFSTLIGALYPIISHLSSISRWKS